MRSLYGIPIPEGTHQVEVRPIFGRGNTRLLYRGPVEEHGQWLTEDDVADHAARNAGFWEYVEAQIRAKKIEQQDGLYSFKLSVTFLDQTGSPAVLNPGTGETSAVTSRTWEFHQLAKGSASEKGSDPAVIALQCARDMMATAQQQHAQAMRESRELMTEAVRATQEMMKAAQQSIATACAEASKLLAAGAEPLRHAVDKVVDHAKAETTRANDATKDMVKLLLEDEDGSSVLDTFTKLATAAPIVIPLAKKALDGLKN